MFRSSGPASVLVLVLVTVLSVSPSVTEAGPLAVNQSGIEGVRFVLEDLQASWSPRTGADGVERHDLEVSGFVPVAAGGGPRLPQRTTWVLVPPGTRPELVVHAEQWEDGGGRLLSYAPLTVTRLDGRDGGQLVELSLPPQQPLPDGYVLNPGGAASLAQAWQPHGGPAVELGETRPWRGRRLAAVRIVPVRYDGMGRVSGVLGSGDWEIRFVPDRQATPPTGRPRLSTVGDSRFAGIFLNPGLLDGTPTEAVYHGLMPAGARASARAVTDKAGVLLAPEIKLGVVSTRLHRVTARRLREQNLLPDVPVAEDEVRLYQRRYLARLDDGSGDPPYAEIEVPIHMVGDGGLFADDDFFVFHGLRMRDDGSFTADLGDGPETVGAVDDPREWNNSVNIYWLAAAQPEPGEPWARMETTTLLAAVGPTARNYRRLERHEEQIAFGINPNVGDDRTYFNAYIASGLSVLMSPQWSPDPDGADAVVRLEVAAAFIRQSSPVDDTVWLNVDLVRDDTETSRVGTINVIDTYDRVYRPPPIPAANLAGNSAKLVMGQDTGSLWSLVNWVEISFDALYRAVNNRLDFHTGDQVGARPLAVTGFGDPDIGLIEVTDPRAPRFVELAASNIADAEGTWTLSVMPNQAVAQAPLRYRAVSGFTGSGVDEFDYYQAVVDEDPESPVAVTEADVLVVTHGDFAGGLDRWIEHRRARAVGDLKIHVVDAADIWDWYGGGMRSPEAIKRLVDHARDQWGAWALVVVGDANENARQLGVRPEARAFSRDWVPTHYHVQNALYGTWEWMATDKWFVTSETTDFPDNVGSPWEMYTGRFPVNSLAELDRVIGKIILMETPAEGQDWRRRGVFLADDSWSDGYGAGASAYDLFYSGTDETFLDSERDEVAVPWASASPVALESDLLRLADWLDPIFTTDPNESRDVSDVRTETRDGGAAAGLRQALQQGSLLAHYQGHANAVVLSSEFWLQDKFPRRDIAAINNTTPWVFFGMGCHVSNWAQNTVTIGTGVFEPSIGEKFLVQGSNGAVATYGSSGYEFITEIGFYCGAMMDRWLVRPPVGGLGPGQARSRWMLGELMWATEADILASFSWDQEYREMCTQFVILGDPLLILDAGPPVVTAVLQGTQDTEIAGETDLVALDATNLRTIEIAARDEAGIHRLLVTEGDGQDLTSEVVAMADSLPPGETDHQEMYYRLAVPIRPYAHTMDVEIWDTGAVQPGDRRWTLTLKVGQEAELTTGGELVDPDVFTFEPDLPVDFHMLVTSAAFLTDAMTYTLTSGNDENLVITDETIVHTGDHTLEVTYTAMAPAGTEGERSVVLGIDTYETVWVLQAGEQALPVVAIGRVFNFPNPMGSSTRFVYETDAASCRGTIRVFSTAGRTVAHIPVQHTGGGSGVAEWDGRDNEGDELANGTYLYRIELDAPGGRISSGVQRLVVMR